jgi:predicted regulator of Ras-like GTPase activity (Roadblock/LC7/MglB family)
MAGIEETLRTLRDVQGVYGSFVISGTGALIARDLPAIFDGDLFAEVGPRVTRLYETFLSGGEDLDACMLRFADHKVYFRKIAWGVIGVLSTVSVNMPALRMVANLVIRKIDPEVGPSHQVTIPPPAALPSVAPAPLAAMTPRSSAASTPPQARTSSPPPERFVPAPPVVTEEETVAAPLRQVRMYRGRPVLDEE